MVKILTAKEAVETYFYSGATVTFGGFANGLMHPEAIMAALEQAGRAGRLRDLKVVFASGQGDSGERGLNHLAVDGLCETVIGGHWGLAVRLGEMAMKNSFAAYNLPQGVIAQLFREIAANRPGILTHVGLETFVDPRVEGGKVNQAARDAGDIVNLTRYIGPQVEDKGSGAIVNISSVVGEYGNIGQANYAAAKAGVIGLTKTRAKEFSRKGAAVRVNCIAPGYTMTDMLKTVPQDLLDKFADMTMLKRLGRPEEIASAALFLVSEEASYVTGQVLSVNGGMRL